MFMFVYLKKEIHMSISRLRLAKNRDAEANKDPSIPERFMQV